VNGRRRVAGAVVVQEDQTAQRAFVGVQGLARRRMLVLARWRFISGLSGPSEAFDRFRINIKQAAPERGLLRLGPAESAAAATEQQKAVARLNTIKLATAGRSAAGVPCPKSRAAITE